MPLLLVLLLLISPVSRVDTRVGTAKSSSPAASIFGAGTEVYGNTLPAVTEPHGQTFWIPQTRPTELKGRCPYYYSDSLFQGFRSSHWLVGGATQDYGSFTLMPGRGPAALLPAERALPFSHEQETATPAYYTVRLPGISAEMTGRSHSAIWRLTGAEWVTVQVNSDEGEGSLEVDPGRGEVRGSNPVHRIYAGKGLPAGFSGHFVLRFEAPIREWKVEGDCAWIRLDAPDTLILRAGTSFTSQDAARANLEAEIPQPDFEAVRSDLERIWEEQLSRIRVEGADEQTLRLFYGSLWRASLLPRTVSDCGEPARYDDFSLWDTYRAQHPLLTILEPARVGEMVQSLLDMYDRGGWLPIFPCWGSYTSEMIGDHAFSVITDAILKGIGGFDEQKAYEAMRHNAFESPGGADDLTDSLYQDGRGRRALESYLHYGFIPLEDKVPFAYHTEEQVSRTLEYAYDDWCLSLIAERLGREEDARDLRERARWWRNVFDPRTGWVQGRHANGSFLDDDNLLDFVPFISEGTPAHYSWYVPHDVPGLIETMGGEQIFLARLDSMFTERRYWHGNEPCHQIAWLYDYTSRPWRTQQVVRDILQTEYQDAPGGLSGNDDAGQMSAWYVFASLGFYPVCPGSGEYALGSPCFKRVQIRLENGKTFKIIARGASSSRIYVRSARLNGRRLRRPFLSHRDRASGGRLVLRMGNRPHQTRQ